MHLLSHCHECVLSHWGRHRGHFVSLHYGHGPFVLEQISGEKDQRAQSVAMGPTDAHLCTTMMIMMMIKVVICDVTLSLRQMLFSQLH